MRYGSICSGVEAASLAWMKLGWLPVFFSEIDAFACAVLKAHFPEVPNLGDMKKIGVEGGRITGGDSYVNGEIDLLVGGTPCQDVSAIGRKEGLCNGERSKLAFEFVRIAKELRANGLRWIVWENVPGALSSNHGEDFAVFLSALTGSQFQFLKEAGVVPDVSSLRQMTFSESPIGFLIHGKLEHPDSPTAFSKVDGACSWSEVLENGSLPEKYFLKKKQVLNILEHIRNIKTKTQEIMEMLERLEKYASSL